MNVCILGAGGLGSLVGGRLAESGVDVTLVGRPAHVDSIRQHGLKISGIGGELTVRDRLRAVVHPDDVKGPIDVLIVLVKAKDTSQALTDASELRPRVNLALSLQNTVVKDQILADWIGPDRVVGASTIEGATAVGPGAIRHTATAPNSFYFGEITGRTSARIEELVDAFRQAGFSTVASEDIVHVEWEKILQISIVAGWSVSTFGALGGSVAQGLVVRPAAEHYVRIAQELLGVYIAMGYEPCDYYAPYSFFRRLRDMAFDEAVEDLMRLGGALLAEGVIGRPSLHDDLLRGKTTEVDYCIGALLTEAAKRDLTLPTTLAAYRIIRALENWLVAVGGVTPVQLPSVVTTS